MMSLTNFLNPVEEDADTAEESEDSLEAIIEYHTNTGPENAGSQADAEDADVSVPVPSAKQALEGLRTLLRFKESRGDTRIEEIRTLEGMERQLALIFTSTQKQQTLDQWITSHIYICLH